MNTISFQFQYVHIWKELASDDKYFKVKQK
jgi:hypothetical protein